MFPKDQEYTPRLDIEAARRASRRRCTTGQVMILAALTIGGTILGATTIAGLLTIYQIRASADAGSSAQAIFAADAGLEWGLYQFFHNGPTMATGPSFTNGASSTVLCYDGTLLPLAPQPCAATTTSLMRSIGTAGKTNRALELSF